MQVFPYKMPRNFINQNYLSYMLMIGLLFYLPLVSISYYFPPFIGILYSLFAQKKQEDGTFIFLVFFYLFLFDITFSQLPFLTISIFTFLCLMVKPSFTEFLKCAYCPRFLYISICYFSLAIGYAITSYVLNLDFFFLQISILLYYIAIECILSVLAKP